MNAFLKVIVTFFAGMGAGLGTGFAGMSAAAVITPMLVAFLDVDPYMAVGIALSSDVLASAVSAYTYGRNKNLDVKNGLVMMASVLAFTVAGSYISSLVPSVAMGNFSVFMTFLIGIKFIVKPVMTTKESMEKVPIKKRMVQSLLSGMLIGFICGFIGAGGGMMMLLILTTGLPSAVSSFSITIMITNGLYATYSDTAVAANGIFKKLGMTDAIRCARNAGLVFNLICLVIFEFFANQIAGLFIDEPETVKLAVNFVRIGFLVTPILFYNKKICYTFQAMGDGGKSLLVTLCREGICYPKKGVRNESRSD